MRGVGQRVYLAGEEARSIMEISNIQFDAA
jgi:hypothetical protein